MFNLFNFKKNTMKKIVFISLLFSMILINVQCTKDFDEINKDPNNPAEVNTMVLLTNAQKSLMDDMQDEWFSGRQGLLWAQYWSQRTYTSEDKYAIRQSTNNTYWRLIYTDISDLNEIIKICKDPQRNVVAAKWGNLNNQIAAATILKFWALQTMTDLYGDIPYEQAFDIANYATPKYSNQKTIYKDMLVQLKSVVDAINTEELAFVGGDIIYGGDAAKWKKFGNSLRLRVALRLSKVTDAEVVALRDQTITDILADPSTVFESNNDNAVFSYIGVTPSNSPMYDAYFTSSRNDFTLAKPFVDLLKGVSDTLNLATNPEKVNPFQGIFDPRLSMIQKPVSGKYLGMPYGMSDAQSKGYRSKCANWYSAGGVVVASDFPTVYIDYAEVCFMMSELNGWNSEWYYKGIRASFDWWAGLYAKYWGSDLSTLNSQIDAYISALPTTVDQNTVMTQKYIAHFMQGYEAWADWKRTGYPKTLLIPGQITHMLSGVPVIFTPLVDTHSDIPHRLTYPFQEATVNGASMTEAATRIGGDFFYTKVWWEGGL